MTSPISLSCTPFSMSSVIQAKDWAFLFWNMVYIFHTLSKAQHQVNFLLKKTPSNKKIEVTHAYASA